MESKHTCRGCPCTGNSPSARDLLKLGDMATLLVIAGVLAAALVLVLVLAGRLRHSSARAILSQDGYQEATIVINGRYQPDTIGVAQGVPVRLHFLRREDNPCSERVVFSAYGVDRRLPAFQETTVEFLPTAPGTVLFTCQWGMYRGKLVVVASRKGERRA